ncbi:MAG TPA: hypothetical protein VMT42_03780 [candidate division Zixibacteria bacterium]|nr:hypothetical protein [candidate division Zixibacteria bacterium]
MTHMRYLILFLLLSAPAIALIKTASAFPASSFSQHYSNGYNDWYDNWEIDRNDAGTNGELPGYLPNLAYETLGANMELAYSIGESFQNSYPSRTDRAVAILKYVQTWTYYAYDSDTFFRNGVAQDEWAQNADEFAHAFNQSTGVTAPGDCEDMAFLCGTIYVGAGFDAAVIDATDHCALLIWLPEFSNANYYWDINDGRGTGWIWVEATGSTNPLGWTPDDFADGGWTAYPITNSSQFVTNPQGFQPNSSSTSTSSSSDLDVLGIIVSIIFAVIVILIRLTRTR